MSQKELYRLEITQKPLEKQLIESVSDLLKNVKLINKQTKESNFSKLELKLHQAFAHAERDCMAKLLEQYDWD